MAKKFRLGAFVASLESDQSEQGTVQKVDAVAVKSSLEKPEVNPQVKQPAPSDTTGVEVAPDGGDDFTAIDKESIAQGEAIHKQLVRLTDAETSLESYLGILREARTTGKTLGRGTAAVMAYDLKSQYPNFFAPVVASLEAIDEDQERLGNNSSSKEVALSKDAEAKGEGRLGKLKAAGAEVWKKFWEWLNKRWSEMKNLWEKLKALFTKEKAKTQFLLGCAKSPNPASVKTDQEGAEGTKTAAAILAIGHDKPTPVKDTPKPTPIAESVNVPEGAAVNSVENDWQGIGRTEDSLLRSVDQNWSAYTLGRIKKLMSNPNDAPDILDDNPLKSLSTAVGGGNMILQVEDGGFKLVDGPTGGSDSTEYKLLSKDDCWEMLDRVMLTYSNVEDLVETQKRVQAEVEKLEAKLTAMDIIPEAKQRITTYLRAIATSDFAKLIEYGMRICKARRSIADAMLAEYVRSGSVGK